MNPDYLGKPSGSYVSNRESSKDEWANIVDRVEAALLSSLANKVLAEAVDRQNQVDEHRRQLKLVELRSFSRKDSVG
jgi:hypothetical protein